MPRVYPPVDGRTVTDSSSLLPPSLVEFCAGFTAGVVSTLVVHPFDVVKTRLQLNQARRVHAGNSIDVVRGILRNEGNVLALYRGLVPNMVGNSVSWALYFLWYGQIKDAIRNVRGHERETALRSSDYFLASGAAGFLTAVATNPIWVIKTRMLASGRNAPGAYRGVFDGASQIWRGEGVKGFYRGLLPSLFGVSHGAIQFMAYEQLKNRWGERRGGKSNLTNLDYLSLSAVSKIFAGSITYPYQVIRARLQTYDANSTYTSARDVLRQVWRREGISGFYKGLGPNIIRILPSTCVTFLVYENTKFYLPRLYGEMDSQVVKS